MIKFECETCFQEYKVRDDRAGQVLKCKSCGEKMRVPKADDDFGDELYEERRRPTRKKKTTGSSKKKKTANANNPISIIAGVCSFGIAFFIAYTFVGGLFGDKKNDEVAIEQEMQQLTNKLVEKGEKIQKAKTKEEKQKIAQSMKTDLDRVNTLKEKQKTARFGTSSSNQKWTSLVDPPLLKVDWPETTKLNIDLENFQEEIIQPISFSPFIGLQHSGHQPFKVDFWNLATEKKTGEVSITFDKNWIVLSRKIKLSADGKYFLLSYIAKDSKIPRLTSWSIETGEKIAEWDADLPNTTISMYEICGSNQVFAKIIRKEGTKYKTILKCWDLTTGKLHNESEAKSNEFFAASYQISPGGKYLITYASSKIFVYDVASLKLIRLLELPNLLNMEGQYPTLQTINFSADGKDLGLLVRAAKETSVWLMNLKSGKMTKEYEAGGNLSDVFSEPSYKGNQLVLSPSGNSFLLYGALLVDRKSKRNVWLYQPVPRVIMRNHLYLTPNYFFAGTDSALTDAKGRLRLDRKPKLVPIPLPEVKVQDSLAAFSSNSDAILSAGKQVSIEVNIGNVKFSNVEEVKSILNDVLKKRLESEGFKVIPDQPLVFKMEYQEQDGNKLQMTKRGKPRPGNPLGRTATGQTLQSTAAVFKLSWVESNKKRTLWSKQALVNPRFLILRNATAEEARKQMFEGLQNRLMAEAIPYFIPQDKNLSMLPGETQLPE